MSEELHNPQFWAVLAVGLVMVGLFIYWLRTGARKPLIPPLTQDHPISRFVGAGRGGGNKPEARDKHSLLDQ